MANATTAVLYAPGTNCHEETAVAIEAAGGRAQLVLLRDLLQGKARLGDFQAAVIPGGFSYGDHLGAGRIFAAMLVARLRDQLVEFLESRKPLLGVCNGFQVLAESGILPARTLGNRSLALLENQSAHFEDRKVRLHVSATPCMWTEGLAGEFLEMPSAHGEGRAFACPAESLADSQVVFRYAAGQIPTIHYPENPSGSPAGIAGITDQTGLVLGLMPHPERAALPVHYSQDGLKLFRNLVRFLHLG
jgi:phosphoribosylformylglycinamidine synthase I